MRRPLTFIPLAGLVAASAHAGTVHVAVAANFTAPMKEIAAAFEQSTGHVALLSFGSTGKLYAQIAQDAPFEVFLAADDETPKKLVAEGLAVAGSQFTYAIGRVVLWSADPATVDPAGDVLRTGGFRHLALAQPKTAPYGAAAMQVLRRLGLDQTLAPRIVQGESIAQTHQFVSSGNAELGFVAMSQVYREGRLVGGSAWTVPATLHDPLRQDAVLLGRGAGNPAAKALLAFVRGPAALEVVGRYGYAQP